MLIVHTNSARYFLAITSFDNVSGHWKFHLLKNYKPIKSFLTSVPVSSNLPCSLFTTPTLSSPSQLIMVEIYWKACLRLSLCLSVFVCLTIFFLVRIVVSMCVHNVCVCVCVCVDEWWSAWDERVKICRQKNEILEHPKTKTYFVTLFVENALKETNGVDFK